MHGNTGNKNAVKKDTQTARIGSVRCKQEEKDTWQTAADNSGLKYAAWVRKTLNRAAELAAKRKINIKKGK